MSTSKRLRAFERLHGDETGVTAIEYAFIASLIAMVVLAGIVVLGVKVQAMWDFIAGKMPAAP
jgi:pilus assembly protein Flp/PilA